MEAESVMNTPAVRQQGFLTHKELAEGRTLALLQQHTEYQEKRLIKLFFKLNYGKSLPVSQISEDNRYYEQILTQAIAHFRLLSTHADLLNS